MRILIVDDDEMVRSVFSGMLQVLKHEPVAVASGAEAIKQLAAKDSRFDLMLLDEAMPGMSGHETILQMLSLDIRVAVIFCSGRNVAMEEFDLPEDDRPVAMLTKPFTLRSLQLALAAAFPG